MNDWNQWCSVLIQLWFAGCQQKDIYEVVLIFRRFSTPFVIFKINKFNNICAIN